VEIDVSHHIYMSGLVVQGERGYWIDWYSYPGNETDDRALFEEILSSFMIL